ncbi:bifunctional folylpolyglutamate synthase/dihydrofolate synthase [Planomicrobium chinense]|uniref:bifunctional folylpolyglutamate synthase/dihydrofolate synthase n=1 Tax=Planococcus chinensis TaxID=272917 RepID=UPI001CC6D7FF|nr:Mur ligase family protein [Planococcus chinensis]MBZ5201203.1 bifunctional folylpolyglutamate synthase/dihydrofolate synthase [Planococcus chinensis]
MINGLNFYKKKWNIQTDASIKPGLQAITAALAELNNPHQNISFIHIAGTNGKGSTGAFLSAILRKHGLTVGNFFSPGIEDLHDQIQVDGKAVTEEDMDQAMARLANIKTPLTDFELLTAAAFLIFEQQKPDIAIIEAGMGGRFDSTNVINPILSIITSISYEHTAFLGDTLENIAWHKAGIIKKWKPIIIGNLPKAAERVIREEADSLHAELIRPQKQINTELKLKGRHQKENAGLALEAAKEILLLKFNHNLAETALASAFIPFRFEEIYPNLIMDGAHNEASVSALVDTIKEVYPDKKIHIVMALMKDKAYANILEQLETISDHFTFIDFDNERALPAKILFTESRSKIKTIITNCDILPVSNKEEVTIVTGSLYLLSALRNNHFSMFKNYQEPVE